MDDKGIAVLFGSIAAVFIYSGVSGRSILLAIKAVISGDKPSSTTVQNPITGGSAADSSGSTAPLPGTSGSGSSGSLAPAAPSAATLSANQALGKLLAAGYGWSTGGQWNALYALWT